MLLVYDIGRYKKLGVWKCVEGSSTSSKDIGIKVPSCFSDEEKVKAYSVVREHFVMESLSQEYNVCMSDLCMGSRLNPKMKVIHNASCCTGQHSPGYHQSRWNYLHSHTAPCSYRRMVMISRWSRSVVYMIIYLGRPLLWTICRSHLEPCNSGKQLEKYRWLR